MHRPRRALSAAQSTKSCNIKLTYVAGLRDDSQSSFSMLREHVDESETHIDDIIVSTTPSYDRFAVTLDGVCLAATPIEPDMPKRTVLLACAR
jgi:hypothetical protein